MWIIAITFSAFFDSLKILIGKKWSGKIDLAMIIWAQWFFALFLLVPLFIFLNPTKPDGYFWTILLLSTVLNSIATAAYWKGVMLTDLSLALPIASTTPIFLLITSPVITGEFPSLIGIAGIITTVVGAYILNLDKRILGFWEPLKRIYSDKGLRLVLFVSFLWSITSNLDKLAINHSAPITYITLLHILLAIIFLPFIIYKNKFKTAIGSTHILLPIGLVSGLSLALQMYAYLGSIVPYVISVKRVNVLFGILLGALILKEKKFKERLAGGIIMMAGIVMILILG